MTTRQARHSQGRADKYFDVGVVGRKTGLMVKPNVRKDMDGFDSIEDFWDSGDDDNGGASRPTNRENQQEHLAQYRLQKTNDPSPAINGSYSSSDLSTLPSPFLYRPSKYRRRTTAVPHLRMSTGPTGSTSWGDSSIERARFMEERSISSISREMERSVSNPSLQAAIDPELLGLLADCNRLRSQGNTPTRQKGVRTSDTSAMTRLSHIPTTNLSRDPHPRNTTAHQSCLSDMFARLQHNSSSRMHDYTINGLRESDLYPLDTPSHPSHSVVPRSMWTSRTACQRRYDPLGVQRSRDVSNYLESTAFPSNEEISEPPMYYFPDEDDALVRHNSIGHLGIEYDEAAVAEMMVERRKAVGAEGVRTAATIMSMSSRQSSQHSSPSIKLSKAQPQKLHSTPRIDGLEASSRQSSPRAPISQTVSRQSTPDAYHPGPEESSGHSKQKGKNIAEVISKMSTAHFDIVPTRGHAPKGKGPPTVLATDKGAESDQYAEVDHSMDSAAAWNELNTKVNSKTKSTATLEIEPTGRPSKQTTAATVAISRKKSKDLNDAFAEPAHPTTQPRPSCIPPRMLVTEFPRAASPCDDTGVRRSRRTRLPPLDYWKNERAIYEQSKTTPDAGRVIKGVIRPSEEPSEGVEMPPSKKQRTAKTRTDPQSKSGQSNTKDTADPTDSCDADDEHESIAQSGFDEELRTEGQIVDPTTGAVIVRELAENKDIMSRFKVIPESGYKHHMGLTCGGLSSGVMKIEPDCEKPNRLAHAGTVIFYVTKGRVAVTINSSTFAVTIGGQFMVPRGNQYSIKNVGHEDSIIFYTRAKAHDTEPVLAPDERKDGKRKRGNTERIVKETKARNKKQLPPPSPEPSPEVPSQSSPEPTTVVTKKGRSTKKLVRSQK